MINNVQVAIDSGYKDLALIYFVIKNGSTGTPYKWSCFIPVKDLENKSLEQYLTENESKYLLEISAKETIWSGSVKTAIDENGQSYMIDKSSVVFPSKPCLISSSSNVIIGDGVDEIILSSIGQPNSTIVIDVVCGGIPSTLSMDLNERGFGEQVFSCDTTPTKIVFSTPHSKCEVRAL